MKPSCDLLADAKTVAAQLVTIPLPVDFKNLNIRVSPDFFYTVGAGDNMALVSILYTSC